MNNRQKLPQSRNVTPKNLLSAALLVGAMLILVWYKETGSRIAALIFAIIPIVGLLFYLKMRSEDRKRAEVEATAELRRSTIGKLWLGFEWLFIILFIFVIIHSFLR